MLASRRGFISAVKFFCSIGSSLVAMSKVYIYIYGERALICKRHLLSMKERFESFALCLQIWAYKCGKLYDW